MKRTLAIALVCLLALGLGAAQESARKASGRNKAQSSSGGGAEADIKKLEADWARDIVSDPAAAVDRYESDDIIDTDPSGRVTDKAQDKQDASSGDLKFTSAEESDLKVHVYGNTAVSAGLINIKGTFKGQDISGQYRFTNTWVKRDGKWQAVASQATKVQQ